jgi:hypothetical protein
MEEYHLTPDELIAKAFRIIQVLAVAITPNGKSEWICAVKKTIRKRWQCPCRAPAKQKSAFISTRQMDFR